MEPGTELDCLIAEKVFGFTIRTVKTFYAGDTSLPEVHKYIGEWIKDGDTYQPPDVPFYSNDISDAWDVVERMCYKYALLFQADGDQDHHFFRFRSKDCKSSALKYGNAGSVISMSHAICLAALDFIKKES